MKYEDDMFLETEQFKEDRREHIPLGQAADNTNIWAFIGGIAATVLCCCVCGFVCLRAIAANQEASQASLQRNNDTYTPYQPSY